MKGERIGAGATCEVFAWGTDRVLKLFRQEYQYAVETEAERALAAHLCGVPSPEVFGIVEVEGRRGILFSRTDGPTLMSHVSELGVATVARVLAQLHASVHQIPVVGLPTLREQLESAEGLDESERAVSLERIDRMPEGEVLCHGDFHPGNIVIATGGAVILDWVNASAAPAAADVARSWMLLGYQGLSDQTTQSIRAARREMADAYLAAYLEFTEVRRDDVARCEPAMAAALLRAEPDNLERKALLAIVDS
jgi:thiamine kinase